jgi:hypothetical protein
MQLFSTEQKSLEINVKSVHLARIGCPDRFSDHIVVLPFNFYGESTWQHWQPLNLQMQKSPKLQAQHWGVDTSYPPSSLSS